MKITPDQARAAIEAEARQRLATFAQAIEAICNEHSCQLIAIPAITQDGRVVATVHYSAQEIAPGGELDDYANSG